MIQSAYKASMLSVLRECIGGAQMGNQGVYAVQVGVWLRLGLCHSIEGTGGCSEDWQ